MKQAAAKTAVKSTATISAPPPALAAKAKATASAAGGETVIDVKMDVGFGNTLFLRGHGAGLTWERGVPLNCVDGKTWRWSQKVADPITFKLLLNDQVWSTGHDLTITPGQRLEIAPSFS